MFLFKRQTKIMKYDYLIVGSGLFGSTFAHFATKAGKKCLVLEKQQHLGGNVYCENIEGINVHKYGPHIFHTSNKAVWDFVNSLVEFNDFTNSPIANYHGRLYNLPFNMNTFCQLWGEMTPSQAERKIDEQRSEYLSAMHAKGVAAPRNLEEQALSVAGKDIYETFIKSYTEKQWGRKCSDLPSFIIKRIPFRFYYDNNYFNDSYQGVPVGGYNLLIDKLLEGVEVQRGVDFCKDKEKWISKADKLVYTGRIDEFYDFCYGELNYRAVRHETEVRDIVDYQGVAVMNFTDAETPYTRIIEHKHFEKFGDAVKENSKTVISKEYSQEWRQGLIPSYPINDEHNMRIAEKYFELAKKEENVIFGGRLAEYKYYDMAPIVEKVMSMFNS